MIGGWGSRLLAVGWGAFLGAFTFLAYTDFALFLNAEWCGDVDEHCFREWVSATSGWFAAAIAGVTISLLIKQINEASRGVEVATEALQEARRSAERQQRAYVYAGQTKFEIVDDAPLITLEITNYGGTPAHHVVIDRMAYIGSAADVREFKSTASSSLGSLAPGQTRYSRTPFGKDHFETHREKIDAGLERIHLIVQISYIDEFGVDRLTTFHLINPRGNDLRYMLIKKAIRST